MAQTQVVTVTRTCDSCGKEVVLTQGKVTHEELVACSGWFVISCEHLVAGDQLLPIAKLACSKPCALYMIENNKLDVLTDTVQDTVQ